MASDYVKKSPDHPTTARQKKPRAPIVAVLSLEGAKTLSEKVTVSELDLVLPPNKDKASDFLGDHFFNTPEEMLFSGIGSNNWQQKWELFSSSLINKAERLGFDSTSLEMALSALNKGRTTDTMLCLATSYRNPPPNATAGELEKLQKAEEEEYQAQRRKQEQDPERYYNTKLALIPVAAHFTRCSSGYCWIILCKWETTSATEETTMGHIMAWAVEAKTQAVLGYVTCD